MFSALEPRGALALVLAGLGLALAPAFVSSYTLSVLILCLIGAYLGQAWNILMGFCGLLSLAHALMSALAPMPMPTPLALPLK